MKKSIYRFVSGLLVAMLLLSSFALTGCGKESEKGPFVYYLDLDGNKLVREHCQLKGNDVYQKADYLLELLQSTPESGDNRQTIPNSVNVLSRDFNGYLLTINFSEDYRNMSVTEEVLVRAAIVRTLAQIDGVSFISFFINGSPLLDACGEYIGSMSADSFVENPGEQINSSITTSLNLYFASADGASLVKETRTVQCSSNVAMEKVVIKQLLDGPKTEGLLGTLPSDTKLISISTVDGVCYVNFDDTFKNQNEAIAEEVLLYSIVNSLTELTNVDSVQISINGDSSKKVRYLCDLSQRFEFREDLIYVAPVVEDTEGVEPTETELPEENPEVGETVTQPDVNTNAGVTDVMNQLKVEP